MSTNAICGNGGKVLIGTHEVAEIGNWSLSMVRNPTVVPKYGTSEDYLVCEKFKWSGSFNGNWYMDDTVGQKAIQTANSGGTTVSLVLSVDGTDSYSGSAFIPQIDITTPYDGIVSFSANFQGSGTLTVPA